MEGRSAPLRALLLALALVEGASGCKVLKETQPDTARDSQKPPTLALTAPSTSAAEPVKPAPLAPLSSGVRIEDERNTIGVFSRAAPSTVFVTQKRMVVDFFAGAREVETGSGSGFIWDDQGHVVTNWHVIQGAPSLWLLGGSYVVRPYGHWVWPLVGFFALPLTTLTFAFACNSLGAAGSPSPFGWLLTAIALLADVGLLGGSRKHWRQRKDERK